jgi:hemolysin III
MQITIREPGSALTHFIGMLLAASATLPLVLKAAMTSNIDCITAMTIFALSMVLLYGASTLYHSVNLKGKYLEFFKKMDHMMIFVLIAGSYTPICMIALGGTLGYKLLLLIWGIAFVGMLIKALWINCPKWFSSIIYIAMGWVCVAVFGKLISVLSSLSFGFLLAGGIIYTIGGVIYAIKIPALDDKKKFFGTHEIFHIFVMGGSICHFICMYNLT